MEISCKVMGRFWHLLSQNEKVLKREHCHWSSSLVFSGRRKEQKLKRFLKCSGGIPKDFPAHSDISNQLPDPTWPHLARPHCVLSTQTRFRCSIANYPLLSRATSSRLAAVGLAATSYSWPWWVWVWAESYCAMVCSGDACMTTDYPLYSLTHLTWSFIGPQTGQIVKSRAVCACVSDVWVFK